MSTALFFLKELLVAIQRFGQHFLAQLLYAFIRQDNHNKTNRSTCYFCLAKDENLSWCRHFLTEPANCDLVVLFVPFEGFLDKASMDKIRSWSVPSAIMVMNEIESVIPALDMLCKTIPSVPRVIVLGASLVPTRLELRQSLFDQIGRNLRQKTLSGLFTGLSRRQRADQISLFILEYEETLGQKNSALMRRVFSAKA